MSENYQTWAPTKPNYDDDEIRETPVYTTIRDNFTVASVGGEIQLGESTILQLARDTISRMWEHVQVTQFSDVILAVFDRLEENGEDHNDSITISIETDEKGVRIGTFEKKGKSRKRFGHKNYAEFIGMGTPKDSALYRECVQALREKCNLDASVLKGGFLLHKTQMRAPERNGVLELVIKKGREGNKVTEDFVAELYQYPFVEQAVPVIQFPPASGDKNETLQTDDVKEVPSMSQMLRQSIIESAMTPAVLFGLTGNSVKAVRTRKTDEPRDTSEDTDTSEVEEQEEVAENTTAPKMSAAHALLDDDDEE